MAGSDSHHSDQDLWASPDAPPRDARPKTPRTPRTPTRSGANDDDSSLDPDAALRRELEGVRAINESIEGVIRTLENAQKNMGTVSATVTDASTLLNTWTRIMSQTEHNQRLILDQGWRGSTQDIADLEAESQQRQAAAERRAAEDERRREEARRRVEEEEQRRLVAQTKPPTRGSARGSVRGRGRGTGRGTLGAGSTSESTSYTSSGTRRPGSGTTRGPGRGVRGRGAR